MYKSIIILLLNMFRVIYAQTQATIYYQVITQQESAESLVEISQKQALPIVLLIEKDSMELHFPQFLSKVFTDKGRIVNPTQFARKNLSKQFLFCPKPNSTEKCLVHTEFNRSEPLQCAEETIPIIETDDRCGIDNVGTLYTLFYKTCPNQEPYNFITKEIKIYEFCYDEKKQKILFTNHYISHPKLLNSDILRWERKIHYDMEKIDEFILSNQQTLEAAIAEEKRDESSTEEQKRQKKKHKTGKHTYKAQKLIPSDDFAFALWRKHTFQYINIALQHENLLDLWNEINHYIRLYAEEIFVSQGILIYARTGVYDLISKRRDDGQMSNTWLKLIYFIKFNEEYPNGTASNSMIIMMNNFIDTLDQGTSSNSQEATIDDYCGQDLCVESLKRKFDDVSGQVRCCSVTDKIIRLLGDESILESRYVTLIPGITKSFE